MYFSYFSRKIVNEKNYFFVRVTRLEKSGKEWKGKTVIKQWWDKRCDKKKKKWKRSEQTNNLLINQLTLLIVNVFQKGSDVFWTSRSRWERHFLSPTYGVLQPLRILWCIRHKQFLTMLAYFIWMCFWFLYRNGSRSRSYIRPCPIFLFLSHSIVISLLYL